MTVSAVRSRQVNPLTSAQNVAVAFGRSFISPRKVNLLAWSEPLARFVHSSASDICANEMPMRCRLCPRFGCRRGHRSKRGREFFPKTHRGSPPCRSGLADLREIDRDRVDVEARATGSGRRAPAGSRARKSRPANWRTFCKTRATRW